MIYPKAQSVHPGEQLIIPDPQSAPTPPSATAPNVTSPNSQPATSILADPPPEANASNFVTQDELNQQLLQLSNSLTTKLQSAATTTVPAYVAANGNPIIPYAGANASPNFSDLTASEIPALNYFPSTSTISIAYGGTGLSNSPTFGQLLLGNGNGGYSLVSTSSLGIVSGGSGTVGSGTQGQFAFYNAAGTTLTATSSLFLSQSGSVSIGTTTPSSNALFSVGTSTSLLYVDNNTGAVDIGSTNASVAPFYVAGKYSSSVVATTAPAGGEGSIVIQGSYVYSVNANNDTFEISDISNPANPVLLATTTPFGVGSACIMGLSVLARYAYVTSDCQSQTAIYDISNPSNPVLLSVIPNENYPTFQTVQGKYLYEGEDPVIFYDISDPHNPAIVFDKPPVPSPPATRLSPRCPLAAIYTL